MVMATVAATQITVRTRMPGRFGFLNTWLKLLSPADPIVMPSGVMFWNDVWTIVTIGHSTTSAIRVIAGPVHGSGSRAASLCRLGARAVRLAGGPADGPGFGAPAGSPGSAAVMSDIGSPKGGVGRQGGGPGRYPGR